VNSIPAEAGGKKNETPALPVGVLVARINIQAIIFCAYDEKTWRFSFFYIL
jgi:hypothetical protein